MAGLLTSGSESKNSFVISAASGWSVDRGSATITEGGCEEEKGLIEIKTSDETEEIKIFTEQDLSLRFNGFNVAKEKEYVVFSSAYGTGASITADGLNVSKNYNKF